MIKISNQDMAAMASLSKSTETSDASLFRKSIEQAVLSSAADAQTPVPAPKQSELPERAETPREAQKVDKKESPKDEAKTKKADRDDPAKDEEVKNEEPAINEEAGAQAVQGEQQTAQDAQSAQGVTGEIIAEIVLPQTNAQEQSGVLLQDEAALQTAAEEPQTVDKAQLDFVGKVLDEIEQQVVGNEAERTEPVIAERVVPETTPETQTQSEGDSEATTGYDLHRLNKNGKNEEPTATPGTASAFGAAAGTEQGVQTADNTVVVELPENPQEVRQAVADSLLSQVESAVSEEKSELYIRFKPDVFGGMAIKLSMTEEGVRAQIRTSDPTMRGMIGSEVAQLTDTLRARGIDIVEVDVMYEQTANNQFLDQRSGHWQGQQEQSGGERSYTGETGEERVYESAYERMIPMTDDNAAGVVYDA